MNSVFIVWNGRSMMMKVDARYADISFIERKLNQKRKDIMN
jgi:hypothetical protein